MAFIPCESPACVDRFRRFDVDDFGWQRFYMRAPVKGRWQASTGGSVSYTVPKSNSYLHNGIPWSDTVSDASAIGMLVVQYERDDRTEYGDFTADQVSFDLRVTGQAVPAMIDPVTTADVPCNFALIDLLVDKKRYLFKNLKTGGEYLVDKPTWDPSKKVFTASGALTDAGDTSFEHMEYP